MKKIYISALFFLLVLSFTSFSQENNISKKILVVYISLPEN